jgi:hypothetical protein
MSRFPALPWLVGAVWLLGTLFAFWFFELRLPHLPWCGGSRPLTAETHATHFNATGFSP